MLGVELTGAYLQVVKGKGRSVLQFTYFKLVLQKKKKHVTFYQFFLIARSAKLLMYAVRCTAMTLTDSHFNTPFAQQGVLTCDTDFHERLTYQYFWYDQ